MQKLIAWLMTAIVAFVLLTVLVFSGVYFTTMVVVVFTAEVVTYYATLYALETLKKTDSNGNC
ncbi:hypothetical protein [Staphylococcus felis]|uniref:Uncharacterized protein n=1 Tax=Staphylococcus felis TaxID=46127 RepID=A0ABS0QS21_9STAP|nr:hypothetical protein [Staphylococcus felis]MBH9581914.1 hypothetical protein [Staphylococcus felis]